jgi:hypothetical protein
LGADATDREERQRRELEEIRRSFKEIGTRMGSLFEPTPPDESEKPEEPEKVEQAEEATPALPAPEKPAAAPEKPAVAALVAGRQLPAWALPAVIALVCLLVGGGLGFLLHRPAVSSAQPTIRTVVVSTPPETKSVAPPVCLETARRADVVVDLLIGNIRDRRLTLALKAYTEASQACRKEASP